MKNLLRFLIICLFASIDAAAPHLMRNFSQPSQLSGAVFYRTFTPGKKWLAEKREPKNALVRPPVQFVRKERIRAEDRKKDSRMLGLVVALAGSSVVGVYGLNKCTKHERKELASE